MLVECPRVEEVQGAICARNKREERGEGQPQRSSEVRQLRRRKHGLSGTQRSERTDRTAELANFELEEKRRERSTIQQRILATRTRQRQRTNPLLIKRERMGSGFLCYLSILASMRQQILFSQQLKLRTTPAHHIHPNDLHPASYRTSLGSQVTCDLPRWNLADKRHGRARRHEATLREGSRRRKDTTERAQVCT
jgi:hypothetical protein